MTRKFKFFSFLFIFLFILFVLGVMNVEKKNTNPFIQLIESILPEKMKVILKKTVFSIPVVIRKTEEHGIELRKLESKVEVLSKRMEYLHLSDELELKESETKKIKSKLNTYNVRIFPLHFLPAQRDWGLKPTAYLGQTNNKIVIASGHGEFFSFEKNDIDSNILFLKRIKSNIKDLIRNEELYSYIIKENFKTLGLISIRDLLILDNKIFFSYLKKVSNDCYNTSIASSQFNLNYLNFTEFFSYEECVAQPSKTWNSGGRMVFFKDGKILLSTGVIRDLNVSQDKNSMFGKIISIDLKTKDYNIISMGHRNPQGLAYIKNLNIIINTEHGPKGGDEININLYPDNKIVENYGWPISSYGVTTGKQKEELLKIYGAPMYKSHKDYGFIEPIKYFTPSIGISEITRIPRTFNEKFTNDFFIGALGHKGQMHEGDQSIHHIRFNENFDKIIFEDIIPIGERIRDMIFTKEKNTVLMSLESIPAIGILK